MNLGTPHIYEVNNKNHNHHALSRSSTNKPKIVIIGAGLSGLTMGYRLNQKEYGFSRISGDELMRTFCTPSNPKINVEKASLV